MKYGTIGELKNRLINRRIVEWDKKDEYLVLDDGTILTIEMSESDCCAYGYGTFKNIQLDAMITDIKITEIVDSDNDDGIDKQANLIIYHNNNKISEANCYSGHNGYYYSIVSVVLKHTHFKIVES